MDTTIVKDRWGNPIIKDCYKITCGCSCPKPVKPEKPEDKESLPPMLLVDDCECTWTLSIINIDGVDYWAVDGVVLVDRDWNPISVNKLKLA